jgi:hypothetical protein
MIYSPWTRAAHIAWRCLLAAVIGLLVLIFYLIATGQVGHTDSMIVLQNHAPQ